MTDMMAMSPSAREGREAGYEPCGVCRPPE